MRGTRSGNTSALRGLYTDHEVRESMAYPKCASISYACACVYMCVRLYIRVVCGGYMRTRVRMLAYVTPIIIQKYHAPVAAASQAVASQAVSRSPPVPVQHTSSDGNTQSRSPPRRGMGAKNRSMPSEAQSARSENRKAQQHSNSSSAQANEALQRTKMQTIHNAQQTNKKPRQNQAVHTKCFTATISGKC